MKIVITGGTGQLGADCAAVLRPHYDIVSVGSKDLDIADRTAVAQYMTETAPQVILNCAAFTQVDACETQKDLAWQVNAEGPRNLAAAAVKTGAKLIHISTDYVFDGRKPVPEPYTEADHTNPISFYGKSKLAGEVAVREQTRNHIILRTAWLYGMHGRNFLKTMLKLALQDPERELRVVNDQYGSPTWSYGLALQIKRLIETEGQGTYHATSEGYGTWYDLAVDFLDMMVVPYTLSPCTTAEFPTPATRPANSILENRRLKESRLNRMADWKMDLAEFIRRFKDPLISETGEERS